VGAVQGAVTPESAAVAPSDNSHGVSEFPNSLAVSLPPDLSAMVERVWPNLAQPFRDVIVSMTQACGSILLPSVREAIISIVNASELERDLG
jgi:hypothetical protein